MFNLSPDPSIFTPEFLEALALMDPEGSAEPEAAWAGPWRVEEWDGQFAVVREGDSEPGGVFGQRHVACLVAVVLPWVGRTRVYSLEEHGAQLVHGDRPGRTVGLGKLRSAEPEVPEALNFIDFLLRSPQSLALLLEAANYESLRLAGQLVAAKHAPAPGAESHGGEKASDP
jgi:hypothetical protein